MPLAMGTNPDLITKEQIDHIAANQQKKVSLDPIYNKLQPVNNEKVVSPFEPPKTTVNKGLQPVNTPTVEDLVATAQRIGEQNTRNQAKIAEQSIPTLVDQLSRRLVSQNVGASSGVGQQIQGRAIQDFQKQLEPVVQANALEAEKTQLVYEESKRQEGNAQRDKLFEGVLQGVVPASSLTSEQWAQMGITDPATINTYAKVDWNNQMIGEGLNPQNPQDVQTFTKKMQGAGKQRMRESIISNYAKVNDGEIPSPDEINMLMYIYGNDQGLLTPEESRQLVSQYNDKQWAKTMEKARAMNPPEGGSVLCTEYFRQGLLPFSVFAADKAIGMYLQERDPHVINGYHLWSIPLTRLVIKYKLIRKIVFPFVKAWAYEMYNIKNNQKSNILGRVLISLGMPICRKIGEINGYKPCTNS